MCIIASQSSTSDTLDKKIISINSSTGAEEDHKQSFDKSSSKAPIGRVITWLASTVVGHMYTYTDDTIFEENQVTLTTFRKMEESVIEDKDAVVETTVNDHDDNPEKTSPSKTVDTAIQDISPSANAEPTEPTKSPHPEK